MISNALTKTLDIDTRVQLIPITEDEDSTARYLTHITTTTTTTTNYPEHNLFFHLAFSQHRLLVKSASKAAPKG